MDLTLWLLLRPCLRTGCWWAPAWTRRSSSCPHTGASARWPFPITARPAISNGVAWYATLGVGAAVLTVIAAVVSLTDGPSAALAAALWLAVVLTAAHSFTTTRAAPLNFSQRAAAGDAARLEVIFDRFERWSRARSALQVLTLVVVTWALAAAMAQA